MDSPASTYPTDGKRVLLEFARRMIPTAPPVGGAGRTAPAAPITATPPPPPFGHVLGDAEDVSKYALGGEGVRFYAEDDAGKLAKIITALKNDFDANGLGLDVFDLNDTARAVHPAVNDLAKGCIPVGLMPSHMEEYMAIRYEAKVDPRKALTLSEHRLVKENTTPGWFPDEESRKQAMVDRLDPESYRALLDKYPLEADLARASLRDLAYVKSTGGHSATSQAAKRERGGLVGFRNGVAPAPAAEVTKEYSERAALAFRFQQAADQGAEALAAAAEAYGAPEVLSGEPQARAAGSGGCSRADCAGVPCAAREHSVTAALAIQSFDAEELFVPITEQPMQRREEEDGEAGGGELHSAGGMPAEVAAGLFTDGHGTVWYYPEPVEVTFAMHEIDGWELRLRGAVDVLTAAVRQAVLLADGGAAAAGEETLTTNPLLIPQDISPINPETPSSLFNAGSIRAAAGPQTWACRMLRLAATFWGGTEQGSYTRHLSRGTESNSLPLRRRSYRQRRRREAFAALPTDLHELEAGATLATIAQGSRALKYLHRGERAPLGEGASAPRGSSGASCHWALHFSPDYHIVRPGRSLPRGHILREEAARRRWYTRGGQQVEESCRLLKPSEEQANFQQPLACPFREDAHRTFLHIRAKESANAHSPPPPDIGDLLRDPELPASLREWVESQR
ncbi:hypothetical protein CYMTET_56169 [Cymbomonas tetramitiformis]|uniref:Uncharacterized protein n=1 Tax=Cymbomonas tetramitiformis TaxID=36881 RepID=A0AAE0EP12_9CHLO|nr:hypothetical protein CYMTET_56169 [Cymbomonas tetramitiformis]